MIDNISQETKNKVVQMLQNAEKPQEAIYDAIDLIVTERNQSLINELIEQNEESKHDAEYAKTLGLRTLSASEKKFYESFKDIKQAITASQIDIIPQSVVDYTLEGLKQSSGILNLVNFAPAGVKKWLSASKSGAYSWGALTAGITGELSATFAALNSELSKMTVYIVIPKAIRDLALPFVDKYFTAVLAEVSNDGLEYGYLLGTGVNSPIGIYKKITEVNSDSTHKDKTINGSLTAFTPKQLAPVKKTLSNNGTRTFNQIYLIANPADVADYVDPALYDQEGRMISSYKALTVLPCANNPQGKAALVIPGKYTYVVSGLQVNEYDQTKALEDADIVIAKVYADGRAVDDNVAYVFDVTKLVEYIPTVRTISVDTGEGA